MTIELEKLPGEIRNWLDQRARKHGTSVDIEAAALLDDAVHERMSREQLFLSADRARIRLCGTPLTTEEIEQAINWGRA